MSPRVQARSVQQRRDHADGIAGKDRSSRCCATARLWWRCWPLLAGRRLLRSRVASVRSPAYLPACLGSRSMRTDHLLLSALRITLRGASGWCARSVAVCRAAGLLCEACAASQMHLLERHTRVPPAMASAFKACVPRHVVCTTGALHAPFVLRSSQSHVPAAMRGLLNTRGKKGGGGAPACKAMAGKGCPNPDAHPGGPCPSYTTHTHDDGSTSVTVDYACLKDGSISYVVIDEGCKGDCNQGKTENVRARTVPPMGCAGAVRRSHYHDVAHYQPLPVLFDQRHRLPPRSVWSGHGRGL